MDKIWLVALGGAVGSCMRYGVSLLSAGRLGTGFPYGTLLANVIGCFIIGAFMAAATERVITNPNLRFLVVVGFCGGLTTFSTFSAEVVHMLSTARYAWAAGAAAVHLFGSLTMTALGMWTVHAVRG